MKRVFITGGSRGIGRACVEVFVNAGWTVGFSYNKSKVDADEIVRNGKGSVSAFSCDFAKPLGVKALTEKIKREFGIPDVLINNAGIASYGLFQDLTDDELETILQVNFKSMYRMSAEMVPGMIQRGSGRIINLASVWGEVGASCEAAYSASKGAVIAFTKALAKELAPSHIQVNAVSPGVVETDMMNRFSEEEKEVIREGIPSGRFSKPSEIAQAILYLAEDAPETLTGQVISINGGMTQK